LVEKISRRITRNPLLVVIIAAALLVPCILGAAATRINYDILTYLPSGLDSTKGENLLEDTFHDAATSMLIIKDMPPRYTDELVRSIQDIRASVTPYGCPAWSVSRSPRTCFRRSCGMRSIRAIPPWC
jgi:predicted RND superfamily exporter protein